MENHNQNHFLPFVVFTFQELLFPGQDYGRFVVLENGTLIIASVQQEDSGTYVCIALNIAGQTSAKAMITVRGM